VKQSVDNNAVAETSAAAEKAAAEKNAAAGQAASAQKAAPKAAAYVIGIMVLAGVTLLGGAIQGHMSRRWGRSQEFQVLADRLQELPQDVGPWRMKASLPLSPAAEAVLECAGYMCRQYENQKTGELVTVALLLGPAGPISVHTPDVCYTSQDYSILESPTRTQFDAGNGSQDELWSTSLQSMNLTASSLRVYYGWSTGGPWSAPDDARFAFAGQSHLYKIQVAGPLPSPGDEKASDQGRIFLKEFLPAVRPYLVKPVKE
jgi:hypothetical protein